MVVDTEKEKAASVYCLAPVADHAFLTEAFKSALSELFPPRNDAVYQSEPQYSHSRYQFVAMPR